MPNFVLIHGAWHDGSCWDDVARHLLDLGYRSHRPTIAGHGFDVDKNVTHMDCTNSIVDYIIKNNLRDFVLVGHSFGGTIISKVAEQVFDRIKRMVYLNAFVLKDGQCLLDENPPHYGELVEKLSADSKDDSFKLPFNIWREAFMNDADLKLAQECYEKTSPQPAQPFRDHLDLKKFYSLDIPKTYLNATEDIALPPGNEWGWHPRMSNRLGLYRLVQMPGSHETIYTNPSLLAEKLIVAGSD